MKLWSELKRRNVLRMTALYLVTAWLILQVTEVLSGLIGVPDWVGPMVLAMLVIGLPIVLVISWFFEITESGITRDPGDVEATSAGGLTGRQFDFIIISLLAAALVVFATLTWWPETPADKSIAVMAFDNMSDHPERSIFRTAFPKRFSACSRKIRGCASFHGLHRFPSKTSASTCRRSPVNSMSRTSSKVPSARPVTGFEFRRS